MRVTSPQIPPFQHAKSIAVRKANRRFSRLKRSVLWKSVGGCLAGGLVFAVTGSSWGAAYTYTPTTAGGTDTWSSGTTGGWTPSAPLSGTATSLTFGATPAGANSTITGAYTSDDNYTTTTAVSAGGTLGPNNGFALNILNLNGTGGTGGVLNITNSGGLPMEFVNNGATAPVINLNALKGTALSYNVFAPLTLDANTTLVGVTGSGSTAQATFNFIGLLNGTGNITMPSTTTSIVNFSGGVTYNPTGNAVIAYNTTNYSGSVDVEGGQFVVNSAAFTPPGGTATNYGAQLLSSGTLTIGAAGTFIVQNSTGANATAAFSALYGSGTLLTGNTKPLAIDYNGATADAFTGTFSNSGGPIVKDGVGVLDLTRATLPLNASGIGAQTFNNLTVAAGTLNAPSLAYFSTLNLNLSTVNLTPTVSGPILGSGNVSQPDALSVLSIVPATSGLTLTAATSGANSAFRNHGGTYALDPGAGGTVTLVIGNTAYNSSSSATQAAFNLDGAASDVRNGHGIIIAPAGSATAGTGINTLGAAVKIAIVQGSFAVANDDATNVNDVTTAATGTATGTYGMVDAGVYGQNNDTNKSGTFLTYVGTHLATDQGFTPVTFDETTNSGNATTSAFAKGTSTAATKELVTANVDFQATSTTGTSPVFALRDDGATINVGNGDVLSIGPSISTIRAGLILNGGSITGGTIALGASQGAFYVSAANATISSAISGTNGITLQGPGVLSITGSLTGLTAGSFAVLGSTLETVNGALAPGALSLENGVYQSDTVTPNTFSSFTRSLGFNPGLLYLSQTAGAGGGFAARGGVLDVAIGGAVSGTGVVTNAGTVLIWGTTQQFLTDNSAFVFGSKTADNTVNFANPLSLGGSTVNYTRVIDVVKNTSSTTDLTVFSGVITTGSNATATANGSRNDGQLNMIAKTGAGTLAFTNNNLYTGGTLVNQGTLLINNTPVSGVGSGTGTGTVTVTGAMGQTVGGALGGTGQIAGAVTVAGPTVVGGVTTASGGTITGGPLGSVGTLTLVSNATINGTYQADILAGASDRLAIGGTLTIGTGATLAFTGGGTATANSYDLANYTSETGTFTTVTGVPAGYTLHYNATELDLVSGAVPEPSTWVGGLVLMGMLGYSQRRRFGAKAGV